jgi:hypothetical protein
MLHHYHCIGRQELRVDASAIICRATASGTQGGHHLAQHAVLKQFKSGVTTKYLHSCGSRKRVIDVDE